MPTFFKRKYMRGRPRVTERVVGGAILVLLAGIVGAFLLTGGLFKDFVSRVPVLARARAFVGISEKPLFVAETGGAAAPAHELRQAAAMLPETAGGWKRVEVVAAPAVGQTKQQGEGEAASESGHESAAGALTGGESATTGEGTGGTRPSSASDEAAVLSKFRAAWVYVGNYRHATAGEAVVKVVDSGSPDSAGGICEALRGGAPALSIGNAGWADAKAGRLAFWAGRYCTIVQADLKAPAEEVQGLARGLASVQLVYGPDPKVEEVAAGAPEGATTKPAKSGAGAARFAEVGGDIAVPARVERYTDNLYEKIDGREGQFRSYHFVEMRFGQYLDTRSRQNYDVYLYDMAAADNAMGIFAAERSSDATPLAAGREGYISGTNAYFWKGKYYVNVLGPPEGGAASAATAGKIATAIAETIADTGGGFWAQELLPKEDLVPESFKYRATSALGYDFLEQMYLADYKSGEKTYSLFVVKAETPAKAAELFGKLAEATAKYDKVVARGPSDGGETMVGESLGVFSVAFNKGQYLAGVVECDDRALAEAKAAALRDRIK